MKKIIFGVFAHPDDEAFGPAGSLLMETRNGTELHLISLTDGGAGTNPDNIPNLGEVRLQEWQAASALLGATSTHHLGYGDGTLNNQLMIEIAERLIDIAKETIKDAPEDTFIEFMTLDLNGYTGHIDHIVAARAAALAFYRLKKDDQRFDHIRFACFSEKDMPQENTDWIYMEAGRGPEEIQQIVDARGLRDDILQVMRSHHTQRADYESVIKNQGERLGLNYFVVKY
jgi:LmbE family N-acetylglucosaminyl deacetylase